MKIVSREQLKEAFRLRSYIFSCLVMMVILVLKSLCFIPSPHACWGESQGEGGKDVAIFIKFDT